VDASTQAMEQIDNYVSIISVKIKAIDSATLEQTATGQDVSRQVFESATETWQHAEAVQELFASISDLSQTTTTFAAMASQLNAAAGAFRA
jgi:methyl-accepting chemotaxis protein